MGDSIVGNASLVPTQVAQHVDPRLVAMFVQPESLVGVRSTYTHFVEPIRPPGEKDEEFVFDIPHTGTSYIDLQNAKLYVRGRLKRRDGRDLAEEEQVVLTNNFLHSLFSSVTLFIGQNQAEIHTDNHPYKAYIKQLMRNKVFNPNLRNDGMEFEFRSNAFANDYMVANSRFPWALESRPVEFLGPTLIDFFDTEGYLLPACPLRIKYRKSRDAFYVVTHPDQKDLEYNFVVDSIGLHIPCLNILPNLTPLLESQTDEAPARYEFEGLDMREFPVPAGTITRKYTKVFENRLPKKILIGFYGQEAFSGVRDIAPLLTDPDLNMRKISLSVNGIGVRELEVNYDADLYAEAYRHFTDWMESTGKDYAVHYGLFKSGYKYYAFDLLENCPPSSLCAEDTIQTGYIDVEVQFAAGTPKHAVMCVFFESPQTVEITKERAARHIRTIV